MRPDTPLPSPTPVEAQVSSLENFQAVVNPRSSNTMVGTMPIANNRFVPGQDIRTGKWWKRNLKISLVTIVILLLLAGVTWGLSAVLFKSEPDVTTPAVPGTTNLNISLDGLQQNPGTLTIHRDLVVTNVARFEKSVTVQGGVNVGGDLNVATNGSFGGTVKAANFTGRFFGDGSGLTNLPGINGNFVALQDFTPGTRQNGNINISGRLIAGSLQGDGAGLTGLNASNLASGTVGDARLSPNVALLNASNTFTGSNTFTNNLLLNNNLTLQASGAIMANTLQQTAAGQNMAINAGNDTITFTAGGRTFIFPTIGPASQQICTTSITCTAPGGTAVLLAPSSAQPDTFAEPSIFINDTGGGNLLHLQSGGIDRFVVANNGNTTVAGSLDVSGSTTLDGLSAGATSLTSLATAGNASVGGTLGATGATTLAGGLTSSGSTAISGPLAVTGSSSFDGTAIFNNTVTVTGANPFSVGTGATTLGGTLDVAGAATFSSTLSVAGLTVFSTLGAADTSASLCRNSAGQLATCNTTGTGAAFVQGGNSFGAIASLGTNDAFDLQLETAGTPKLTVQAGGNVGIGTTGPGAKLQVNTGAAGTIGQIIQGAASQTADLQQWQNSAGTSVARITAAGELRAFNDIAVERPGNDPVSIRMVTPGATWEMLFHAYMANEFQLRQAGKAIFVAHPEAVNRQLVVGALGTAVTSSGAANPALTVIGAAAQTGNLTQWQNSTGTVLARVDASGNGYFNNGSGGAGAAFVQGGNSFGAIASLGTNDAFDLQLETGGTTKLTIQNSTGNVGIGNTGPGAKLQVNTETAGTIGQIIRGAASQTADLQQWQDSDGAVKAGVTPAGLIFGKELVAGPSATVGLRMLYNASSEGEFQMLGGSSTMRITAGTLHVGGTITQTLSGSIGYRINSFANSNGGDPLRILDQAGTTPLMHIDTWGRVGIRVGAAGYDALGATLASGTSLMVQPGAAAALGVVVKGQAAQTGDLQQWQNSAGTVLARVDASGNGFFNNGSGGTGAAFVQGGNSFGSLATLGTNDAQGLSLETTNTERMRIDASGKVGIGTAPGSFDTLRVGTVNGFGSTFLGRVAIGDILDNNVSVALAVAAIGNGSSTVKITGAYDNIGMSLVSTGAGGRSYSLVSTAGSSGWGQGKLVIEDNGAAALALAGGNLGIGTTFPSGKLHVQGTDDATNTVLFAAGADTAAPGTPNMTLQIKASGSQAANLQEWLNNGGIPMAYIKNTGAAYFPISTSINQATIGQTSLTVGAGGDGGTLPLLVVGGSNHFANLLLIQNSGGASRLAVGAGDYTDTAGTKNFLSATPTFAPTATSTATFVGAVIQPTINFSNATPGAGNVTGLLVDPIYTAAPTGTKIGLQVNTGHAEAIGQVIRGAASQTADLLQLQNSAGTLLSTFDNSGNLGLGAAPVAFNGKYPMLYLDGTGRDFSGSTQLYVKASAYATRGNPIRIEASGGATLLNLDRDGRLTASVGFFAGSTAVESPSGTELRIYGATGSQGSPDIMLNGGDSSAHQLLGGFTILPRSTTTVPLKVKGVASQTADLLQAQDSTGAVLASISATGNLTAKNATFNGTLSVNGHIITGNTSGTTTVAAGAAACTTPTVSVSGNDTAGTITVTTGTGCAGTGVLATVTFAGAYGAAPRVTLTPANANGAMLNYYKGSTTTTFTLETGTVPTDATTYTYDYQVLQ